MIVIDPSKGGSDTGVVGNGITEKEFNLLISEYIYDRLKELGADVKIIRDSDKYISDQDRASKILNSYGNNSKVVALSNQLNNNSNGVEIIYALRNKDTLAKSINDNLENAGINVDKYYQRRSESDTSKDYSSLQRDTGSIETIIVDYGNVNNNLQANDLKNNYKLYAEAVIKALANYQGIPYYLEGKEENIYVVKKGDSLYSIASKYNTTVDEIKRLNNLKTNNLSIGQILNIPAIKSTDSTQTYIVQSGDSLYSISKKFNISIDELKKINNLTNNTLQIGQVLKLSSDDSSNVYVVKKGDSLYSIAKKYNTTVDELKKVNNLSTNNLSIGQKLKIPTESDIDANYTLYTVKSGDSLYSIANKYNVTVNEIINYNNLSSNTLQIGQQLKIPTFDEKSNNNLYYTVEKGDSLYSIASKYNTTVDELINLNNLNSNLLQIGQQLKIK